LLCALAFLMVSDENQISLDEQIRNAKAHSKEAGDFGMEILGPMLISALIEAGKALWKIYIKKIGEKAADKLADITVNEATKIANAVWHKTDDTLTMADYDNALRNAADKNGLSKEQTEHLIAAIRSAH